MSDENYVLKVKLAAAGEGSALNVRISNADEVGNAQEVTALPTPGEEYRNVIFRLVGDNFLYYLNAAGDGWIALDVGTSGVTSVNGDSGPAVVLDATDVGADPTGTGASEVAAHNLAFNHATIESNASTGATHAGLTGNPHGTTSDDVPNDSAVIGATVTDALNTLAGGGGSSWQGNIRAKCEELTGIVATDFCTSTNANALQLAIDALDDGDVLEVQTSATYDPIILPTNKEITIMAGAGYLPKITGQYGITLVNGVRDTIVAGISLQNCTTGDNNGKGAAICFAHQAIVTDVIFYDCAIKLVATGSAVMLSYHQSISGDNYATASTLAQMSERVAFVGCAFSRGGTDGNEGGNLCVRGIKQFMVEDCQVDANNTTRGISIQNCIDVWVRNNLIINCRETVIGNGEAIKLDSIGTPVGYRISGAIIGNRIQNAVEGIDIDDTTAMTAIYDNVVSDCRDEGISLDGGSAPANGLAQIIGNVCFRCANGIRLESGSTAELTRNVCFRNTTNNFLIENGYSLDATNTTTPLDAPQAGDAISPTSSATGNFVAFDDATGKTYRDSGANAASFEPAGAAASAVSGHTTAFDHSSMRTNANAGAAHAAITGANPHGASLSQLDDVDLAAPTPGEILTFDGTNWKNGAPVQASAGPGVALFLQDTAANVGGYNTLLRYPAGGAEDVDTVAANATTSPVFIEGYISDAINRTSIDAGVWNFDLYAGVSSNTGVTQIRADVYTRAANGTETLRFQVTTAEINGNSAALYNVASAQAQITGLATTDRIVFKFYALTTSVAALDVHLFHNGSLHYSHCETPLAILHNEIAGIQGGAGNEAYHLTAAQAALVAGAGSANGAATLGIDGVLSSAQRPPQDPTASVTKVILQANSFDLGDVLRRESGSYVLAQANTLANCAGVVGIVTAANATQFTLTTHGRVDGISGLADGQQFYLSAVTAGLMTATAPTIAVPILTAVGLSSGIVEIGLPVSTGGASEAESVRKVFTKSGHSFARGNAVRGTTNDTIALAQADSNANAAVTGVVDYVSTTSDASLVFLCHCDGTANSTTFIDEMGHSLTAANGVTVDTSEKKFGSGSANFIVGYATGSCISAANSTDWDFGTANFTVEFQVRRESTVNENHTGLVSTCDNFSFNTGWRIEFNASLGIQVADNTVITGSVCTTGANAIAANTWTHVAVVRAGDTMNIYLDGVNSGTANVAAYTFNSNAKGIVFGRGATQVVGYEFRGRMDEIRICKGSAKYTGNFTPPSAPFTAAGDQFGVCFGGKADDALIDLSVGEYYLSQGTAGLLTSTRPSSGIIMHVASCGANATPPIVNIYDETIGSGASLDINGTTQLVGEPASEDAVIIYDKSAAANRKQIMADHHLGIFRDLTATAFLAATSAPVYSENAWRDSFATNALFDSGASNNCNYDGSNKRVEMAYANSADVTAANTPTHTTASNQVFIDGASLIAANTVVTHVGGSCANTTTAKFGIVKKTATNTFECVATTAANCTSNTTLAFNYFPLSGGNYTVPNDGAEYYVACYNPASGNWGYVNLTGWYKTAAFDDPPGSHTYTPGTGNGQAFCYRKQVTANTSDFITANVTGAANNPTFAESIVRYSEAIAPAVGTDFKCYFSMDGGANWEELNIYEQITTGQEATYKVWSARKTGLTARNAKTMKLKWSSTNSKKVFVEDVALRWEY